MTITIRPISIEDFKKLKIKNHYSNYIEYKIRRREVPNESTFEYLYEEFNTVFKRYNYEKPLYTKQNMIKAISLFQLILLNVTKYRTIYFSNLDFNKYFQDTIGYSKSTITHILRLLRDNGYIYLHEINNNNHNYKYEINHKYINTSILKIVYTYI
jgi:DNA-binding transcriptional ArsR family regulator